MYDFINFEIDNYTYPDLDNRFPAEYPRFIRDEMVCWTECGCHWTINAPLAEEYSLREWLLEAGIQVSKCSYSKRVNRKEWLIDLLTQKKQGLEKYLSEQPSSEEAQEFGSGARYKLIYTDGDMVENLYNTHYRPGILYREAIQILDLAIAALANTNIGPINHASCGLSGFYANGGNKPCFMNLDAQLKKDIELFDINIASGNSAWSCKLVAVRQTNTIMTPQQQEKKNEIQSPSRGTGRKVSYV
jgi:hypothetical protein